MTLGKEKLELLELFVEQRVLEFGAFTLKSGRQSPYFFNLGAIHRGSSVALLGRAYARRILAAEMTFDCVFGPAYKGIPLAVATAAALAEAGQDVGWAFNRKEAKAHGEGGLFVGAPVQGRVVVVDDVLTAGTAVREAAGLVRRAGAQVTGVVVAMDRQEIVGPRSELTAVQSLQQHLEVPVESLLNLQDVIEYLDLNAPADKYQRALLEELKRYRAAHCAS